MQILPLSPGAETVCNQGICTRVKIEANPSVCYSPISISSISGNSISRAAEIKQATAAAKQHIAAIMTAMRNILVMVIPPSNKLDYSEQQQTMHRSLFPALLRRYGIITFILYDRI